MDIDVLIENVNQDKYSEKQLIALYKNTNNKEGVKEEQKERLVDAIEKNTRLRFPRAAKKIFGAKESVAMEKLEGLYKKLITSLDFSKNKLKNGVKSGGRNISGEFYIDLYMSYKNANNHGAYISLTQVTIEEELEVTVGLYSTHNSNSGIKDEKVAGIDYFEEYSKIYKNYLCEVII
jgi:hypothetical protein